MNWTLAIELNRDALLRLLAALFDTVGLRSNGAVPSSVSRLVHVAALRILRPAESAVRRLAMILEQGMTVGPQISRPMPKGAIPRGDGGERLPSFPLFDPKKPFLNGPRRRFATAGPRIRFFDSDAPEVFEPPVTLRADTVDAGRLCRRLLVLKSALDDLPKQARRLARWRARTPSLIRPIRPGRPPGHRTRRRHEVDRILAECHQLALLKVHLADTS